MVPRSVIITRFHCIQVNCLNLVNIQQSQKEVTQMNFNQFGMKLRPNLNVNWLQLNLQIGFN